MKIQGKYREAVHEFVNRALQKYGADIDSIILFGSVARGEAREDSDIDILVIWTGDESEGWRKMTGIAFDVLLDTGEYISVKVFLPQDLKTGTVDFFSDYRIESSKSFITPGRQHILGFTNGMFKFNTNKLFGKGFVFFSF
ncbi:MAG: nucleotidyltransferase domain-containing protein [Euryarchaeota archaeon]